MPDRDESRDELNEERIRGVGDADDEFDDNEDLDEETDEEDEEGTF
jgi:hypothetical protein